MTDEVLSILSYTFYKSEGKLPTIDFLCYNKLYRTDDDGVSFNEQISVHHRIEPISVYIYYNDIKILYVKIL